MIMTNPRPYPKIIPASHIDGPEGSRTTGKKAKEATSTRARTGRPNAVDSHCRNGMRTYVKRNIKNSIPILNDSGGQVFDGVKMIKLSTALLEHKTRRKIDFTMKLYF